jgi:hypothetical protein
MTNAPFSAGPQGLWQSQPVVARHFSPEEMQRMNEQLQSKVRWRNAREYAGGALAIAASGWFAWHAEHLGERLGHGLIIAGVLYVCAQLRVRGSARALPDATARECVAFQRAELQRQHDLLRGVWRWYLAPLVPGLMVLFASHAAVAAAVRPLLVLPVALAALFTAAVFVVIGKLNLGAAARLREQIRQLEAEEAPRPGGL